MPRIGGLDRRDPLLEHVVRGAAIALERELHVLGRDRVAVVEIARRRAARNRSAARPSTPRTIRRGSARSACPASASRPRRAARTASCTGVMMPEVSAGSNQVGASETWTPQVNCPCGAAARANPGRPAVRPSAANTAEARAGPDPAAATAPLGTPPARVAARRIMSLPRYRRLPVRAPARRPP